VVGTSDHGVSIYSPEFSANHVSFVFGGLHGIEPRTLGDPDLVDFKFTPVLRRAVRSLHQQTKDQGHSAMGAVDVHIGCIAAAFELIGMNSEKVVLN
jgi:hypothetical protein